VLFGLILNQQNDMTARPTQESEEACLDKNYDVVNQVPNCDKDNNCLTIKNLLVFSIAQYLLSSTFIITTKSKYNILIEIKYLLYIYIDTNILQL
jgi:hypothetical protein